MLVVQDGFSRTRSMPSLSTLLPSYPPLDSFPPQVPRLSSPLTGLSRMPLPPFPWRCRLTSCAWMDHVALLPIVMSVFLLAPSEPLLAQPAISRIVPQAVAPGKTTRIQIVGQNIKSPVRVGATAPVNATIVSVDPTQATIDLNVPAELGNGPFGAWIATADGPSEPFPILIDPLPSISDNETNHALSQSQQITLPCAVDGTADASLNDFYRFALEAGMNRS